jgi:hypothetical protein
MEQLRLTVPEKLFVEVTWIRVVGAGLGPAVDVIEDGVAARVKLAVPPLPLEAVALATRLATSTEPRPVTSS